VNQESVVHVIDDDPSFRQMLRWLFESVAIRMREFGSARDFLARIDTLDPGCLVLDLRMPEMDGLALLETLHSRWIMMPVIVVSAHGEIPSAVRSLRLGAIDFLEKPVNHQQLLDRVHAALDADREFRQVFGNPQQLAARLARLTPREREIMDALVQGKANKVIAADLGTSARTIESHRANLMHKLGLRSLPSLVQLKLHFSNLHPFDP
jgi:two-component system, LuxR family, response regulator FixJ